MQNEGISCRYPQYCGIPAADLLEISVSDHESGFAMEWHGSSPVIGMTKAVVGDVVGFVTEVWSIL
jgi:hypothetical protein